MKICAICKVPKPLDDFHRRAGSPDGRQSYCKSCRKQLDVDIYRSGGEVYKATKRSRQRERAKECARLVYEYLLSHPCVDCGESDPVVLDFDHVRGEKRYNVADLVQTHACWETVLAEIEKCEVRCANCHRRVTAQRRGGQRHFIDLTLVDE